MIAPNWLCDQIYADRYNSLVFFYDKINITHRDNIPERDKCFVWFIVNLRTLLCFNVSVISLRQITPWFDLLYSRCFKIRFWSFICLLSYMRILLILICLCMLCMCWRMILNLNIKSKLYRGFSLIKYDMTLLSSIISYFFIILL